MTTGFTNWSGSQVHENARVETPASEEELLHVLARARAENQNVRAVGSSHSFVPFWTDGFVVSLDNMKGLVSVDADLCQATFRAGSKLHEIGDPLWANGMSMQNMGDIDRQSIAGAVSTGTHGTGETFRNLSSQLVGMRLMKADGEVLQLNRQTDPELFRAAQVSLGMLGVITQATLQLVPAYYLHERNWTASVGECAEQRLDLIASNRHWEFFWDPASDTCAMKTLNIAGDERETVISDTEETGRSYRIIPSSRDVKFNEIEFSLPAEMGWECFLAVRELMQTQFPKVRWPLEYRTLHADDLLISSASERETVTISAHQGINYPYREFFLAVENIFRRYEGRPHWGKVHTQSREELRRLYPHFDRFADIRHRLDPEGLFLNPFLTERFAS